MNPSSTLFIPVGAIIGAITVYPCYAAAGMGWAVILSALVGCWGWAWVMSQA